MILCDFFSTKSSSGSIFKLFFTDFGVYLASYIKDNNKMKTLLKTCFAALFFLLLSSSRNTALAQGRYDISYQNFYDELNPYGEWINNPEYGYVWSPHIQNFRPYNTDGHWVWTD